MIREVDCGTTKGIRMRAIVDAGQVVASLASRILGRSTAEDIVNADGEVIVPEGTLLDEQHIAAITAAGVQEVKIRWDADCPVCGKEPTITELIDYEAFCGVPAR